MQKTVIIVLRGMTNLKICVIIIKSHTKGGYPDEEISSAHPARSPDPDQ
ncbi:MAG: hypothetical protein IKP28_03610 [Clostridia bacterium]|nr:hypothetical protein [Clostridia bacterium]